MYSVKRFWATVCKTVRPMLSDRCLTVCPVCDVGTLWPNGWMDQDETRHARRPRTWPPCVRWGLSFPSPKGHSPQFSAHICCDQMVDVPRRNLVWRQACQPKRHCVRCGPSSFVPKKGQSPFPIFCPCLLWPNGWMDQDGTWHGGGPRSRPQCAVWRPSSLSPKGGTVPNFRRRLRRHCVR